LARFRKEVRRLANDKNAAIHFIECSCPEDRLIERLHARETKPTVSDARRELLSPFKARYQEPNEIPPNELSRVDTCKPVAENMIRILSSLSQTVPAGGHPISAT
jgi:predicted kinase